jgi:hypothetical protein
LKETMITQITNMFEKYIGLHLKCLLCFSYFNKIWIFWIDCGKTSQYDV